MILYCTVNFTDLWLTASTAATTYRSTWEGYTRHCVEMMYGIKYNAEAVERNPALGDVLLPTPRGQAVLSQCCPLCQLTADSPSDLACTVPL